MRFLLNNIMFKSAAKTTIRAVLKAFYKVEVTGLENIPLNGPAIIVSNHQSFLDAVVLCAFLPRDITFLAYYKLFEIRLLGLILQKHKDIPIKDKDPEQIKWAFQQCCDALNDDRLLCIFPEGSLTPDGDIKEFKRGLKHLWTQCAKPIIPVAIDGFWDTAFSRKKYKFPGVRQFFTRKTLKVNIGPCLSYNSPPDTALLKKIIEVLQKHK